MESVVFATAQEIQEREREERLLRHRLRMYAERPAAGLAERYEAERGLIRVGHLTVGGVRTD